MSPIKFILVIFVLCQIFSNGKTMPALAEGFNVVKPIAIQLWQKQTVIEESKIVGTENTNVVAQFIGQNKNQFIKQKRARMVAFLLPKVERIINIEKVVEDLHRLRRKVEGNV